MLHLCEVFGLDPMDIAKQTSEILKEETGETEDIYLLLKKEDSSLLTPAKVNSTQITAMMANHAMRLPCHFLRIR